MRRCRVDVICYRFENVASDVLPVFSYGRTGIDAGTLMLPREATRYLRLEHAVDVSARVVRDAVFCGHIACYVIDRGSPPRDYHEAIDLLCLGRMRFTQADVDNSRWLQIERLLRGIAPADRAAVALEHGHVPSRLVDQAAYQAGLRIRVDAAIAAAAERFSEKQP